jgi:hypothetical protein
MSEVLVTGVHLREARARYGGYCTSGMARWFARHGLSLGHFLRHGYPISSFDGVQDEMLARVLAIAKEPRP